MSRLMVRALYRLALAGMEMNTKDSAGETALIKSAAIIEQQRLSSHLIRLGILLQVNNYPTRISLSGGFRLCFV